MKKLILLILAFVAIATGASAATDYGFSIAGQSVTSDNYQSLSSGQAWSYDPSANVLHLKDGEISNNNATIIAAILINGNVNSTLNISVDGNCKLSGKFNNGIKIGGKGNHTFSGTGKLTIALDELRSVGINSDDNSNPNVTFKDLTVIIRSYGGYGFKLSFFKSIAFDHCDFNITTTDGWAMKGDAGSCKPQLILCTSDHNWYSYEGGCGYSAKVDEEGLWAPSLKISRSIKYVGVRVSEPMSGQNPATTATTISSGYEVTKVTWYKVFGGEVYPMQEDELFKLGESYEVSFTLKAKGDSVFADGEANEAAMITTVNGNKADYFDVGNMEYAYMNYTFPELVGTKYALWVGGKQVNDANKDDVLGNRIVSYDPETKTLSLKNGTTITGKGSATNAETGYGAGIYSEIDGLTIDVEKGGVEVIGADDCHGIYLRGKTTIKGEGSLSGKGYIGVFMGSNSADLTVDGNVMLVAEGITSNGLCGYSRTFAGLTDVEVRLRLERNNKKSSYYILFFARFALTFSAKKLGCVSEEKTKIFVFILFFARFALTLQLLLQSKGKNITVAAMVEW